MAIDKLAALQAAQDESDPEDTYELLCENNPTMEALFNEIQAIREMLSHIEECVKEVKELHSTLLMAPQGDPKDQQRLEDLEAEIKQNANRVRSKLKQMEPEDKGETSSAESRMRMAQHMTLTKKLKEIITDYTKAQVNYSALCKARLIRQLEIVGKQCTNEEVDEMLENGDVSVFTFEITTDTRVAKQQLADIEARHADLMKLETSIKELHHMFLDMAMLVEGQGELMDRIEYQVGLTKDYVEEGTRELNQAARAKDKARKKKIMIVVCLTITGIVTFGITGGMLF